MQLWYLYKYGPILVLILGGLGLYILYRFYKEYFQKTKLGINLTRLRTHLQVSDDFLTIEQRTFLSATIIAISLMLVIINPWGITALATFLSIIATWAYSQGQDLKLIRKRKILLGVAGFLVWFVIFIQFRTVIGHSSGIGAITILIALKLFEIDKRRDAIVLLFLSQMLVMGIFFFSQEIFAAIVAILIEILLFTAQATIFQKNHLFWNIQMANFKNSIKLIFGSLILGVLLFVLFPRPVEPLWSFGMPQQINTSGLSESMSPGSIDSLALSSEIVFQVEFLDNQIPENRDLYWRGPSFINYSNNVWRRGSASLSELKLDENVINAITEQTPKEVWKYKMILEPTYRNWVYGLETPVKMSPVGNVNNYGLLESKNYINTRTVFQLTSIGGFQLADDKNKLSLSDKNDYIRLPAYGRQSEPRLRALVKKWLDELSPKEVVIKGTPIASLNPQHTRAIVNKALQYFRENKFKYTLEPTKLTDDNPNDNFLFDTRNGFCEHYAGAFTLLMRAAGIPARVVTGYQGGEINSLTGIMLVRQSDAHAWSEVWIDGEGWQRVDPTSAVSPARIERSLAEALSGNGFSLSSQTKSLGLIQQAVISWEAIKIQWNRWVIMYDQDTQSNFFSSLSLPKFTTTELLTFVVIIILTFLAIAYNQNRPQKPCIKVENKAWYKLLTKLQNQGIAVDNTYTLNNLYNKVEEFYKNKKFVSKSAQKNWQEELQKKLSNLRVILNYVELIKYAKNLQSERNEFTKEVMKLIKKL